MRVELDSAMLSFIFKRLCDPTFGSLFVTGVSDLKRPGVFDLDKNLALGLCSAMKSL